MEAGHSFEVQEPIYQLTQHYTPEALNCHQQPQEKQNILQQTNW
jgi:hypothetical protein